MNREQIYSALFAQLAAIPEFTTVSRRLKHWTDTPQGEQPALFQAQVNESAQTTTGQPTKWVLRCDLYLYVRAPGKVAPATLLNPLVDAICNKVNAVHPITGKNTLGLSNVEYCRIEGSIETDEGTLGEQAVAIIPVTILAT